mmetsp:Transcript_69278/g.122323  ORF Transcript_69278/g.122323 Transcript_69278/m.122323 type:complete len:81 (-) Transcript_69278:299-541(-)
MQLNAFCNLQFQRICDFKRLWGKAMGALHVSQVSAQWAQSLCHFSVPHCWPFPTWGASIEELVPDLEPPAPPAPPEGVIW